MAKNWNTTARNWNTTAGGWRRVGDGDMAFAAEVRGLARKH